MMRRVPLSYKYPGDSMYTLLIYFPFLKLYCGAQRLSGASGFPGVTADTDLNAGAGIVAAPTRPAALCHHA